MTHNLTGSQCGRATWSKLAFSFGLTASLALYAAASGAADTAVPTSQADLRGVTLVIGEQGSDTHLGFVKSHLFDDTPYRIRYATFQSPTATLTALAAGKIDLANNLSQWTLTQGAAAATTPWTRINVPYRTVLVTGPDPAAKLDRFVIVASRASGITDIHQSKGKRWGYVPGAAPNLVANAVMHQLGWSPSDVEPVAVDGSNQALALETGRVDVIFNVIDNAAGAIQHGAKLLGTAQEYGLTIYTGYQANSKAIADPLKGRAIGDFVHRLVLYHDWLVSHPREAQQALVEGLHETPAQAAAVYEHARLVPIPPAEVAAYSQKIADFALETGLIHQHVDAAALLEDKYGKDIAETLKAVHFQAHLQASYH